MIAQMSGFNEAGRALPHPDATAKATLELALRAPVPEGALSAPDGIQRAFCGWAELAAVIEEWWCSEATARASERRQEVR